MEPTVVTMRADSLAVAHRPRSQSAWLSLAYAADAPDVGERAYGPARLTRVHQLRAGSRQYVRGVWGLGADYQPTESFVVDVSEAIFERRAAWRVVTSSLPADRGVSHDTAWVGRTDLKLLFRRFHGHRNHDAAPSRDTLLEQYTTIRERVCSPYQSGRAAARDRAHAFTIRRDVVANRTESTLSAGHRSGGVPAGTSCVTPEQIVARHD